ncbi:hypothetical protein NMG60_11019937 [Bertholletia excelsa]
MTAVFQTIQKRSFIPSMPAKQGLPVSQTEGQGGQGQGLRRRLSSLSLNLNLKIQAPSSFPSPAAAFRRCKSVPSSLGMGESSIRKWWEWGWGWILSRKPTFASDLEMNEEETAVLGCHSKGSWRHVFYKMRSELRRLMGDDKVGLPQTFSYDSFDYSKNFDDGKAGSQG